MAAARHDQAGPVRRLSEWLARRPVRRARALRAGQAAAAAAAALVEATPGASPGAVGAAFFDVDNTVMRGASLFHLARGLHRRNFFARRDLLRFAAQQAKFVLRGAESLADIASVQTHALGLVRGHTVVELSEFGEEIWEESMAAKVWPGAKALAQRHLDLGQQVWLVTASPVEVATTIARRLGLTGALGTVVESVDGVYTGRLVGEALHGPAKVEAVRALAEREGIDLERCAAYSDSANDIPLLSLVGHPCAVNPDRRLRRHARAQSWPVQEYRTGRRAAQVALPVAVAAGAARWRRSRR